MPRIDAGHDGTGPGGAGRNGAGPIHPGDEGTAAAPEAYQQEVVLRLLVRFGDRMSRNDLESLVHQAAAGFADARIHSFVPILVEHQAADWVHAVLRQRRRDETGLGQVG